MLRRLSLGLVGVVVVAAVAACNSSDTTLNGGLGVGPNFPTTTLYAANSSQNAISIYPAKSANGAKPAYQIAGPNTGLSGPQYVALDSVNDLWVTNFNAANSSSSIDEIKALATGSVQAYNTITSSTLGQPRGIAIDGTTGHIAVATVFAMAAAPALPGQIQFYTTTDVGVSVPYQVISGSATGLNVPTGVAFGTGGSVFVANRQGASVESFVVPTPTPTPSTTPSPTPTPTATPTGATPSPSPTPQTGNYLNLAPTTAVAGASTGLVNPTGVALDGKGNIYVADSGNPSVRVFAAGATGNVAPIAVIAGSSTGFVSPTDVKLDGSGEIYVADQGAGAIFVFAAGANGNVAPILTYPAIGSLVGIGLIP